MVGSLIFFTHSRPDISFAVSCANKYFGTPQQTHLIATKRILRYIKGMTCYGVFYLHASMKELISYANLDSLEEIMFFATNKSVITNHK
jgi:hypothetical protein